MPPNNQVSVKVGDVFEDRTNGVEGTPIPVGATVDYRWGGRDSKPIRTTVQYNMGRDRRCLRRMACEEDTWLDGTGGTMTVLTLPEPAKAEGAHPDGELFRNTAMIRARQWNAGDPPLDGMVAYKDHPPPFGMSYVINTLEGQMLVSPGDWVATGVKGEKYPIKLGIFTDTYEPATPPREAEEGPYRVEKFEDGWCIKGPTEIQCVLSDVAARGWAIALNTAHAAARGKPAEGGLTGEAITRSIWSEADIERMVDGIRLRLKNPPATSGLVAALEAINAIRNDIIGRQDVNWSAHVYPLVAALNKAGFQGLSYDKAKALASADAERGGVGVLGVLDPESEHYAGWSALGVMEEAASRLICYGETEAPDLLRRVEQDIRKALADSAGGRGEAKAPAGCVIDDAGKVWSVSEAGGWHRTDCGNGRHSWRVTLGRDDKAALAAGGDGKTPPPTTKCSSCGDTTGVCECPELP